MNRSKRASNLFIRLTNPVMQTLLRKNHAANFVPLYWGRSAGAFLLFDISKHSKVFETRRLHGSFPERAYIVPTVELGKREVKRKRFRGLTTKML